MSNATANDATTDIAILTGENAAELRSMNNDDVNAVITFDDALSQSGFNEEDVLVIASPYRVLKGDEKAELVGVPFYMRSWRFAIDGETERPYVVVHAVTKANDLVILTDGSTGIFAQLSKLSAERIKTGHATPFENGLVANGLRYSEYMVDADGKPIKAGSGAKPDGKARTYYLA